MGERDGVSAKFQMSKWVSLVTFIKYNECLKGVGVKIFDHFSTGLAKQDRAEQKTTWIFTSLFKAQNSKKSPQRKIIEQFNY